MSALRFLGSLTPRRAEPTISLVARSTIPKLYRKRGWARAWHALGGWPLGSEAYRSALQALTDRFAAGPGRALASELTSGDGVAPRAAGEEAELSPLLTGTTLIDEASAELRSFDELGRRQRELHRLVCVQEPLD